MKDFKIIIPSDTDDDTEIDATLQGRDERTNLAFIKANAAAEMEDRQFASPGEDRRPVYSAGLLPKGCGGIQDVRNRRRSLAHLRGPSPAGAGRTALSPDPGGVCLDSGEQTIGWLLWPLVLPRPSSTIPKTPNDIPAVTGAAELYIPTRDFLKSLANPTDA